MKISGKNEEKNDSNKILNKENIIFIHEDSKGGIESIFSFKDGDLLVFKNTFSIIFDGNTFQQKLVLPFLGAICAFLYLSEEEFILLKGNHFSLFKFKKGRTEYQKLYTVTNDYEENKKIFHLSNDNLIKLGEFNFEQIIKIYQRNNNGSSPSYNIIENTELKDIDCVYNLEQDEFLTIQNIQNSDEIFFKVYSNIDYTILRFNRINCTVNNKRRIYFSQMPFFKVGKNKILYGSIFYLNIFGIDTLELETTVNISESIKDIKLLSNDCIILVECQDINWKEKNYFLTKIWFDFEKNEIKKKETTDITDKTGDYKTLFNIYNYLDNGLATISDHSKLKVYKNINS